jgi:hypothetical protein
MGREPFFEVDRYAMGKRRLVECVSEKICVSTNDQRDRPDDLELDLSTHLAWSNAHEDAANGLGRPPSATLRRVPLDGERARDGG